MSALARLLLVRLRFLLVLLVAVLLVGRWEMLRNYFDKLTRSRHAVSSTVSTDTEFWCPMCPGVVSEWPSKCPVCNMTLVQRKRGEAVPLPDGVMARMQLSPYRMQLAGVKTLPVGFQPLVKEVRLVGAVSDDDDLLHRLIRDPSKVNVRAEVLEKDLPFLRLGQKVRISSAAFPGRTAWNGRMQTVRRAGGADASGARVLLEADDPKHELRPGFRVTANAEVPMCEIEPFRSMPRGSPPARSKEAEKFYFCPDHPEILRDEPGQCPHDRRALETGRLATNQQLGWWCPMHIHMTADKPGAVCPECQGMKLVPRIVTYSPAGEVLAVPESAVLDTGKKKMVYVERMRGMFDAVEVILGPRCGDFYPVICGLEPEQRVVASGAFLVDAETRLNPSIAVGYFGAANAPAVAARAASPPPSVPDDLLKLPPADRAIAMRQKTCPVTDEPLGSMGVPFKVMLDGKAVFLCCKGCEKELRAHPQKYLDRLGKK